MLGGMDRQSESMDGILKSIAVAVLILLSLSWRHVLADEQRTRLWCGEVLNSVGKLDYFISLYRELAQKAPSEVGQKQCESVLADARASQDQERKRQLLVDYQRCMVSSGSMAGGLVLASKESFLEEIEIKQRNRARLAKEFSELRCGEFGFVLPDGK